MARVVACVALLWSLTGSAQSLTLAVDGQRASFSGVHPGAAEQRLMGAARIHVVHTTGRWSLLVRGDGALTSRSGRALPLSRLQASAGAGQPVRLTERDQLLLADQPPTPESGRIVTVDYLFTSRWGDATLGPDDRYEAGVSFTAVAETTDHAFASPSPFSPDGDGDKDRTALQLPEGAPPPASVVVLDAQGATVARLAGREWDGLTRAGVRANDGAYRLQALDASGRAVASAEVRVDTAAAHGTAMIHGQVASATGEPLPDVEVTVRSASGVTLGKARSDATGAFAVDALPAGFVLLEARRELYLAYTGPLFELAEGAKVRSDLRLVHNHSLIVGLTASATRVKAGELVALQAAVRAVGTTDVEDVRVQLALPRGLVPVAGTLRIDGVLADAELGAIPLGHLPRGEQRNLRVLATFAAGTALAVAEASATGVAAGEAVTPAPATVALRALPGELSGHGGVHGRICFDVGGDGACDADDPAAPRAAVFLEDGSHAQADARGLFHLAPLRAGRHVLLAGPGPLELGARPGSLPALPRAGASRAMFLLPPGQYVGVDVALPVPPGFRRESAEEASSDEGEVPLDTRGPIAVVLPEDDAPQLDEGSLDDSGSMVGFRPGARASSAAQLDPEARGAAGAPFAPGEPAGPEPISTPATAEAKPLYATSLVGLAEATLTANLGVDRALQLTPAGRLAFTLQHDFSTVARASLVVDTGRAGREALLATVDPLGVPSEFGDDATVAMSQQERLYLRLDLPWLYGQVGRMSLALVQNELLFVERSYLGVEAGAGGDFASVRAFAGFASEHERRDEFAGADSTGPYTLSLTPVVPGSERIDVEVRTGEGEVLQRSRLAAGADYFLDAYRGTVQLGRPLPATDGAGNPVFLVVQYQVVTEGPLLQGLVAGGRAQLGTAQNRVGLTALYQERAERAFTALSADARATLGPVQLETTAGWLPEGDAAPLDRAAGRARLTVEPIKGWQLFGFGSKVGAGWDAPVRSRGLSLRTPSPFGLLEQFRAGGYPLTSVDLALSDDGEFPVFLQEDRGRLEWGGGTRVTRGPVRGLALYRRSAAGDGTATDLAGVGVAATVAPQTRLFAGHETLSAPAELWGGGLTAPRSRDSVVGLETALGGFHLGADYLHQRLEPVLGDARDVQTVTLRGRAARWRWLQPAAMAALRWEPGAAQRKLALGVESEPTDGLRLFAYGQVAEGAGAPEPSAFAGVALEGGPERRLAFRYELSGAAAAPQHRVSWDGRYRLIDALVLQSDGQLDLGGVRRLVRVGAAFRPAGPVRLLARAHEEVDLTGASTLMGSVDLAWTIAPRVRVDLKYLARQQQLEGHGSIVQLGGAATTYTISPAFDVTAGGRYLRDALSGAVGGYTEVGYTFGGIVRLAAGVNAGTRSELFTLAGQAQGVYLNLTAVHAGPLGPPSRAAPVEELETVAPAVVQSAPPTGTEAVPGGAVAQADVAPAPSFSGPRTVTGRLFLDANTNGAFDTDEPVFDQVPLAAGPVETTTDKQGRYRLAEVPPGTGEVQVKDRTRLSLRHVPAPAAIPPSEGAEVEVPLVAQPRPQGRWPEGVFALELNEGTVKARIVERAAFPLAAWVAGLPLSGAEAAQMQRLAEGALGSPKMRLVIAARAQSNGALAGAFKRAWRGGLALKRYLQATQMLPPKRLSVMVLEPHAEVRAPLGEIELLLVELQ